MLRKNDEITAFHTGFAAAIILGCRPLLRRMCVMTDKKTVENIEKFVMMEVSGILGTDLRINRGHANWRRDRRSVQETCLEIRFGKKSGFAGRGSLNIASQEYN